MLNQNLLLGSDGYLIQRSLRFRRSASAFLTRTPSTTSNRKTWTWSGWVKLGIIDSTNQQILASTTGTTDNTHLWIGWTNGIIFWQGWSGQFATASPALFRDPSAWYHLVLQLDTTQATASDRIKTYINGVRYTMSAGATGFPALNADLSINLNQAQDMFGRTGGTLTFDGYAAEVNFIDSQALSPSSFGETDPITGVWKPKKYSGTYGTNGFYLNFSDNSAATAAAIGKDSSGNGNNWTPNNISVTAGATYDSMTDVPTLTSETQANYAVMNPLVRTTNNSGSISQADGNLSSTIGTYANTALSTIGVSSGKWYWEMTPTATNNGAYFYIGIAAQGFNNAAQPSADPLQWAYYGFSGNKNNNNNVAYGASYTTNDVIGVALDMDTGTLTFYKNGTSQGVAYSSGLTGYTMFPMCSFGNTGTITVVSNFGQRPFAYTPPSGFKALNTFNLPDATIKAGNKHFDVTTYTGNGSTQSITNSGSFQPNLVWAKGRSTGVSNSLYDSIRGVRNTLSSNATNAENLESAGYSLTAFNSNGFSVGLDNVGIGSVNGNGTTYVAWQWKAGGTAVTNTSGSITSQVSANASAGFSIVTYTGNGTNNATVGHGLGVAPDFIIVKMRGSGTSNWPVWHRTFNANDYIALNLTSQVNYAGAVQTVFGGTAAARPTSTVITFGTELGVNNNGNTYVAYCFSEVSGYSKFGSYTGNGSADGPFVHLGFRPKFVLVKASSTSGSWVMLDTARDTYNYAQKYIYADASSAEAASFPIIDVVSNGFKVRDGWTQTNTNGATYIYMAFAENPFKYSLAR